jgi:hypothetical protein
MSPKPKTTDDQTETPAADEIFDQTAGSGVPPAPAADPDTGEVIDADDTGRGLEQSDLTADDHAEIAAERAANTPGFDFAALAAKQRSAREAAATDAEPTSGPYHNAPESVGEEGDGDFFVNMAEADVRLEPMAIGTRLVVSCTKADAQISGSGNPMIVLRVKVERVVSTIDAATDTKTYKNRTVRDNLLFIPPDPTSDYRGTIWRANQAMKAFGVDPDKGIYRTKAAFMAMLARQADLLRGCVCEIEVGIDDGTKNGTQPPAVDPATGEAYPPKNTITRYYAYRPPVAQAATGEVSAGVDDLPF